MEMEHEKEGRLRCGVNEHEKALPSLAAGSATGWQMKVSRQSTLVIWWSWMEHRKVTARSCYASLLPHASSLAVLALT